MQGYYQKLNDGDEENDMDDEERNSTHAPWLGCEDWPKLDMLWSDIIFYDLSHLELSFGPDVDDEEARLEPVPTPGPTVALPPLAGVPACPSSLAGFATEASHAGQWRGHINRCCLGC
jgi:hypothetical protein